MKTRLAATFLFSALAAVAKTATGPVLDESQIPTALRGFARQYSQEKIDRIAGFFAPVCKKYRLEAESFQRDFLAASNRTDVMIRYLPKAEAALAEARSLKIPPRYEAEKAEYIRQAELFLSTVRLYLKTESFRRRLQRR